MNVVLKRFVCFIYIFIYLAASSVVCPSHESLEEITFGMSAALTGPTAYLGINIKAGIELAFWEINQEGGINGRPLKLICLDDGYEPRRTVPNTKALIQSENVLAIIGNVGTPTCVAAIPIALRNRTLLFGAYTGAGVLRKNPPDRYVINYRASYGEETAAIVDGLILQGGLKPEEIAFFSQRDAYGDAGFSGGIAALKRRGLKEEWQIVHGRYERNTVAVENALADVMMHPTVPKAIVAIGAYAPCAKFIRLARERGLRSLFVNLSFVGSEQLKNVLGEAGEGVIVTQVVPHYQSDIPIVREYRRAIQQSSILTKPTFVSFEGYVAARILLRGLKKLDGEINRESIVEALESLGDFDVGLGVPLHLDPSDHQACHHIWPTIFQQGEIREFEWKNLSTLLNKPGEGLWHQ